MSKDNKSPSLKEVTKETAREIPKEAPKEHKESTPKGAKIHAFILGSCKAIGCKAKSSALDFCPEHFEQFKFGLIKKSGESVPDLEKKMEHYEAFKAKKLRKVA
jgi:hypothetical protein